MYVFMFVCAHGMRVPVKTGRLSDPLEMEIGSCEMPGAAGN